MKIKIDNNAEWYKGFVEGLAAEYNYGVSPIIDKCLGFETQVEFKETQTDLTIKYWPNPSDGDLMREQRIVVLPSEMNESETLRLSLMIVFRLIEDEVRKFTNS